MNKISPTLRVFYSVPLLIEFSRKKKKKTIGFFNQIRLTDNIFQSHYTRTHENQIRIPVKIGTGIYVNVNLKNTHFLHS